MRTITLLSLWVGIVLAQRPCPPPKGCPEDHLACPDNSLTTSGCPAPDICVPLPVEGKDPDAHCPVSCPIICAWDEFACPAHAPWDPTDGCPGDDHMCVPGEYPGINGFPCPNSCPMYCQDGEEPCYPQMDENGCIGPNFCVPVGQCNQEPVYT